MDESRQEARRERMTTKPVYPLLVQMAVPSMIGMMVGSVYSMTDTFWIGRLNRTELTASVGTCSPFC